MVYSIIKKSQLEAAKRLDAEYYQPEYLSLLSKLFRNQPEKLLSLTEKIDVGFVSSMTAHFQESGVPLLRTQNVQEFSLDFDRGLVFIDEAFHKKLRKSILKAGYVLLARSGSIGSAAVVPEGIGEANSADIIFIKTKEGLLPDYLAAFLNSKYGQFQIERASSGGLQGHINLFSLEQLLIPAINLQGQQEINQIVRAGLRELENAKSLYSDAEIFLLQELELTDFEQDESLSWTVHLSNVKTANRADAEYFHPKYEKLISKIKNGDAKVLGDLVSMKKGIETGSEAYQEEGKLFIRVSSLSKNGIEDRDQKYLSEELYQKLRKDFEPKAGEILLTKDATPGIAYHIKEPIVGIVSGGILRLNLKDEIEPEYLALCINSVVGQMQVERDAGGSIIAHWRPEQIKDMQIPIVPRAVQQKIAELVRQAHEARKRSKQLLEEAKRKVEEAIEKEARG